MGPEARSCKPCAASKRKCGKQTPHCLRCRKRGVLCTYPPAKPSQFILITDENEAVGGAGNGIDCSSSSHQQQDQKQKQLQLPSQEHQHQQQLVTFEGYASSAAANLDFLPPLSSFDFCTAAGTSSNSPFLPNTNAPAPINDGPWFAAPSTWKDVCGPFLPDPARFPVPNYHCYNKYIPRGRLTPPQTPPPPSSSVPSTTTQVPFDRANLRHHIRVLRGWLAQWVDEGGNQFIHPELYIKPDGVGSEGGGSNKKGTSIPQCMQDAFLALSCYLRKTEGNEDLVFGIVEEKAAGLLRSYGISDDDEHDKQNYIREEQDEEGVAGNGLSSIEQIARTQALLVYQFIGLFDGDVRARYVAEGRMDLLSRWARSMVEGAECEAWLDGLPPLEHPEEGCCCCWEKGNGGGQQDMMMSWNNNNNNNSSSNNDNEEPQQQQQQHSHQKPEKDKQKKEKEKEETLWRSWILAESARRTWIIAGGMRAIFLMMQRRHLPTCTAGLMYTSKKGLWEATSGREWGGNLTSSSAGEEKKKKKKKKKKNGDDGKNDDNVGFIQLAESAELFNRFRADEVGDFAKFLLGVAFGTEKVKRWDE